MQKYCTWTVLLSWEFSPKETCRTLKIILAAVTFISVRYGIILCDNYLFLVTIELMVAVDSSVGLFSLRTKCIVL